MNHKGIKLAVLVFFLLMVADFVSTYASGDLVQYLEANPLYPHVWLIVLINIVVVAGLYVLYTKIGSTTSRFVFMNTLVTICVLRITVIWRNIQVAMDPPTIQQAMQVTEAMKAAAVQEVAVMAFLPYLIGYLTYLVFKLDHDIKKKESETLEWDGTWEEK